MANETEAAVRNLGNIVPLKANGTINKYRFVKADASDDLSVQESDSGELSIGTSIEDASDGDNTKVQIAGVAKVEAGGSVTSQDQVEPDADGKAVTQASSGNEVAGIALQDGDDGDIISVLISIKSVA